MSSKIEPMSAAERDERLTGPVVVFKWAATDGWPVVYVSPNVEEVFGYPPELFDGGEMLYSDVIHPDDRKRVALECEQHLQSGASMSTHLHYRAVRADGEVIFVDEANRLVRDEDGTPSHYVGHVVDVSKRSQAAERLRRRKATLSEALEIAQLGYWEWDLESGESHWSDEMYWMLGVERAEIEPSLESFVEFVHPEDTELVHEIGRATLIEQNPYNTIHRILRRSDGELRYLRGRGRVGARDDDGRALRIVGTVQDITETVRAEEILRSERSWLLSLIEALPGGISFRDGEGRWLLANRYALEFLGIRGVDYQGKTTKQLAEFSDNYRVAQWDCRDSDHKAWESGESYSFKQEIPTRDGELRTFVTIKVPVYEEDGSRKGLLVVARDITERKKLEQLKEEFVSIVSHELRTPLTPITGVLAMLASGSGGELSVRTQKMVDLALRNSHRLLYLVDDLLDIQKMSSGQMDFQIRDLDLAVVVRESLRINAGLEHKNSVKFVFEDRASHSCVRGDKGRLIQVMTNLLSNAAKFSAPNTVIDIFLERTDDDRLRVSVVDDGPGIPEDFQHRVFEKFAQADSSSTRKHGGTGLGLTISKSIIERLDGEIGFETEPGEGTTFYFELPISK
jgi:PAS domain S-box-containing protein